jgi:hypothetical protein
MEAVSLSLEEQEQQEEWLASVPLDHLSLRQTKTEVRFRTTYWCNL